LFNTHAESTNSNGEIHTSLVIDQEYAVSAGLEAISFAPLLATGGRFAEQSPVIIEAQRLVERSEPPCRVIVDGLPSIYFSSLNATETTLTVPLEYTELNSIYSVTGQAVPATSFSPGKSGFAVPEQYFRQGSTLLGVWKFLGQNIPVASNPDICTDQAVPKECTPIDPAIFMMPFDHTRKVVRNLSRIAVDSARSGRWRGSKGLFSTPLLSRFAKALAAMKQPFGDVTSQNLICNPIPQSCRVKTVPKKKLLNIFKGIFKGSMPRGLEQISARADKESVAFQQVLEKIPNSYVSCE